tara:strand:- start:444 stop:677 length:234 start_codon:yes stop_codon:yes gene_type:complete
MHVNPNGNEKGLLVIHNPLEEAISRNITVNLYYTGLSETALISEQNGKPVRYKLNREYCVKILVIIRAKSQTYLVIK